MKLHFCYLLLAASTFVGKIKGNQDTRAQLRNEASYDLPQHFRWLRVDSTFVELGWDIKALGYLQADEIKLTANLYEKSVAYKYASVPFSYGKLTLEGLRPSTTYEMIVEARRNEYPIYSRIVYLATPTRGNGAATASIGITLLPAIVCILLMV